jgi:formamidase
MHAFQGDGEIAGHTADVAGLITLQVQVLKGLKLEGPVLFPVLEDLPFLAKPLTPAEQSRAEVVAKAWGVTELEASAPISIIGTGVNLNLATNNGLERAGRLLDMTVPEVMNRATITGAIEIGRHPGVVQVTFRAPLKKLEKLGLLPLIKDQYGL